MPPELQPLLDALTAKHGWVLTFITWSMLSRPALKLAATRITAGIESAMQRVTASKDTDDDELLKAFLKRRWYRVTAFMLDTLFHVKLPLEISLPDPKP